MNPTCNKSTKSALRLAWRKLAGGLRFWKRGDNMAIGDPPPFVDIYGNLPDPNVYSSGNSTNLQSATQTIGGTALGAVYTNVVPFPQNGYNPQAQGQLGLGAQQQQLYQQGLAQFGGGWVGMSPGMFSAAVQEEMDKLKKRMDELESTVRSLRRLGEAEDLLLAIKDG